MRANDENQPYSMTVGALLTLRECIAAIATAHTLSLRDNRAHALDTCAARIRRRSKRRKRAIRVPAVCEWKIWSENNVAVCRAIHLSSVSDIYFVHRVSYVRIREIILR